MVSLTKEEKRVLLALAELEPATLDQMAAKTGIETSRLKSILLQLAEKGLLDEP